MFVDEKSKAKSHIKELIFSTPGRLLLCVRNDGTFYLEKYMYTAKVASQ